MVDIKDGWFSDRVPGGGKVVYATAGDSTTATPVGPPVIVGSSGTVPGPPNPPPGNPNDPLILPDSQPPTYRAKPDCNTETGKINACGFDGYSYIHSFIDPRCGWATTSTESVLSTSCSFWFSSGSLISCTVTPVELQGIVFQNEVTLDTYLGTQIMVCPSFLFTSVEQVPNVMTSTQMTNGTFAAAPYERLWTLPTTKNGWNHVMASLRVLENVVSTGAASWLGGFGGQVQTVIYVNDTQMFAGYLYFDYQTGPPKVSYRIGRDAGGGSGGDLYAIGGTFRNNYGGPIYTSDALGIYPVSSNAGGAPINGTGLKGALTELWVDQARFVDWSVKANRYKFHASRDPARFVPVDLGATGAAPFGRSPSVYMTGGASDFKYNRAMGNYAGTVVTEAGGSGLYDVSLPF